MLPADRHVLADRQPADVERRVHAQRAALELAVSASPILLEIVEGDVVRVVGPTAGQTEIGVAELRRTKYSLPPVRPGAPRHDQKAGVGVRRRVDAVGPAPDVLRDDRRRIHVRKPRDLRARRVAVYRQDFLGKVLTGVVIAALDYVEILKRILHQHVVQPTRWRRDAGPDLEPRLPAAGPAFLGLDDDDAVAGPRPVDRRARRILEDLDFPDVGWVQEVQIGLLHRSPIDDVQRIVVVE